ncbi:uncharacterized protein UTRI_05763_B [Ustilago trichophora]|uniref:Ubiquitin-like domain-containing protein n=1 Tax=Ustilago trichophora TaxID=86804 RepID=A0A5C3ERX6_9BASI|nr:uncharacterized protein UTRI_05763_B [Ustilago trichophora]
MDPSSDSSLHLNSHHHSQRHQRFGGPSQPSASMSSSSSSHPQGPASPSSSTAASSNPFVRSHHNDPPEPIERSQSLASEPLQPQTRNKQAPLTNNAKPSSSSPPMRSASLFRTASSSSCPRSDHISVAIKCPSLDKDSAVVQVEPTDTVLALKHTIERSWPGAPRPEGMRCIRSGRILNDNEIFAQLVQTLEPGEPLSLHLVIRPDAWSDPQNRPTPSRRSSYLRQQQQQQQQQQQSLLRSALATQAQVPTTHDSEDDVPPLHSATSNQTSSNWSPQFEPYFSQPSTSSPQATPELRPLDTETLAPHSNINSSIYFNMSDTATDHNVAETLSVLDKTLRVTAPDNWPMLVEALSAACDEYVLKYEAIYNQAHASQMSDSEADSSSSSTLSSMQSDVLTSVETTLLGWGPIPAPSEEHAASALSSSQTDTQCMYQQISHRGLPYLLRIATTPLDIQRSEALHTLLTRISTLRTLIDKLEHAIMLGRLIQVQHPQIFAPSGATNVASVPTQLNGAAAAGQAMALEQGGFVSSLTRFAQTTIAAARDITFADVTAVMTPMFFVGFKVGILLSVMLRGADTTKKFFVLGMASIYVAFESFRIVQRRMRVRQRAAARTPPVPPLQQPNANAPPADQPAAATPAPAPPMGANVPTAPTTHERTIEEQIATNPHLRLPPPQAPPRFRTVSRFSYDWWIDHLAFIGLEVEDEELALLPPRGSSSSGGGGGGGGVGLFGKILTSSWVLPVVLFVVTMMPAVEQRRKQAIEERVRVVRKWLRLEGERRERLRVLAEELKRSQEEKGEMQPGDVLNSAGSGGGAGGMVVDGQDELQKKRVEYAAQVLHQRRNTEAVDLDEDDGLIAQAIAANEDDDDQLEDMNIF